MITATNKAIFEYGRAEMDYLRRKDKKLGVAIDTIGMIEREITPNTFGALISSIVSQQISGKAAATVFERLCTLLGDVSPETIVRANINDIQKCGLSMKKAGYIKGAGEAALSGQINFSELPNMKDDQIIKTLSALHGVGVWTAEMLLIFSLGRPDVVSWGDFGIRKGMMNLYGLKELPKEKFERYKKRYTPYGSIASFYLWELATEKK